MRWRLIKVAQLNFAQPNFDQPNFAQSGAPLPACTIRYPLVGKPFFFRVKYYIEYGGPMMMNENETSPYPAKSEWAKDDRETAMQVATLARVYTIRHGLIFRPEPDRIRPLFMPMPHEEE